MSTSFVYHALGVSDQQYKSTGYKNGEIIFEITPKPKALRCSLCNAKSVIKRGVVIRDIRTVPIGSKTIWLRSHIQRVWCPFCQVTRQIKLSFADRGKRYTRAFEKYVLSLSPMMTIKDIANHLKISWDTVKEIQKNHLTRRYKKLNYKKLKKIAIDEISIGKGHQYITIVMDLDSGRIFHVGKGKGADALTDFWVKLKRARAKIKAVGIDMSPAYISAVVNNLPGADIVFDRFHVVKLFNEKLSDFRRSLFNHLAGKPEEQELIKGTRWLLLKNPENLQKGRDEDKRLKEALELNQPLATAYYLKEELRQIWNQQDKETGNKIIQNWIELANASKIPMLMKFTKTLGSHKSGILSYYDHRISSGPLEGTNNKIKTMKRQAYGYRDQEFFKLKLFDLHTKKYALIG